MIYGKFPINQRHAIVVQRSRNR